jgi:RsiW-degrading membrane proteinase PrsW (M82 family)
VALGIVLVLLIVWLPLALRSATKSEKIFWVLVALVLVGLLVGLNALMVWLTHRR